jgi:hypothetical protein
MGDHDVQGFPGLTTGVEIHSVGLLSMEGVCLLIPQSPVLGSW